MMERERISPAHIDLLRERARLSDYVAQRVILVERAGEYSGLCPFHTEKSPSFTVNDSKGFYHCFGCGAHGNVFDWLMNQRGLNFVEAVRLLESDTGLDDPRDAEKARADMEAARKLRAEQEAKRNEKDLEGALSMWKEARAPQQSAVSLYLRWRGVTLPDKSPLKCHPGLPYWYCRKGSKNYEILGRYPAMLAAIQGPDGAFIGVHRTYLSLENGGKAKIPDPDNPGKFLKPKKMKGAVMGGAIRLSAASRKMAVAEGIENGLTAMMVDPDLSVWVAGSLNNICGRGIGQGAAHPEKPNRNLPSEVPDMQSKAIVLPDIVEELLIIGDNDGQDRFENQAKLNRAGNRFTQQGLSVRIALPDTGKDLNDMLQGN